MEISQANENDLDAIVKVNRLFHLDIPDFKWDTPEWVSEKIKGWNYYTIKEEGNVYGAMCLIPKLRSHLIETIAVDEDHQKEGIGTSLVEFAKDYAKQQGKINITVESFLDYNLAGFYESVGFKKIGQGEYRDMPYYKFAMEV